MHKLTERQSFAISVRPTQPPKEQPTEILVPLIDLLAKALRQTLLKPLHTPTSAPLSPNTPLRRPTHLQNIQIRKVSSTRQHHPISVPLSRPHVPTYLCPNHAAVTIATFSLTMPKNCGQSRITTTAFWTVERVTSGGLFFSSAASSWRVQEMPKREVAGESGVASWRRVK